MYDSRSFHSLVVGRPKAEQLPESNVKKLGNVISRPQQAKSGVKVYLETQCQLFASTDRRGVRNRVRLAVSSKGGVGKNEKCWTRNGRVGAGALEGTQHHASPCNPVSLMIPR